MSTRSRLLGVCLGLVVLGGCNAKDTSMNQLPDISANIKKQLAFTCTQEKDRIPPRDPEADQLYVHARWRVIQTITVNETTQPDTALAMNQPTSPRASTV